jgi:hypothetical protein
MGAGFAEMRLTTLLRCHALPEALRRPRALPATGRNRRLTSLGASFPGSP